MPPETAAPYLHNAMDFPSGKEAPVITGISVVIPYYNDVQTAPKCIEAVGVAWKDLSPARRARVEVILVDDCSDLPLEKPDTEFSLRVIRMDRNQGVGNARNKGAELALFSHAQFIDSDVLLTPHYLTHLFDRLEANPGIKVMQGPFSEIPANENPTLFQWYMSLTWAFRNSLRVADGSIGSLLSSGCVMFSKQFFRQIGGFVRMYKGCGGEEYEIISRIAPGSIVHDDHLTSYHYYDTMFDRLGKSFKRGLNFRATIGQNKNIPVSFKITSGVMASFALSMTACWGLAVLNLPLAIYAYMTMGLAYCVFDAKLMRYIVGHRSFLVAAASVIFMQLEYTAIALAMVADAMGGNVNVQRH